MTNVSAINTASLAAAAYASKAVAPAQVATQAQPAAKVVESAPMELTVNNPVLASHFAAQSVYDVRGVQEDGSPRGVEIDRIEMIKTGFEHIRNVISTISENAQAEADQPVLNTTV